MENLPDEEFNSNMTRDFPNPRKIGRRLIGKRNGVINHSKVERIILAAVPSGLVREIAVEMSWNGYHRKID